MGITPQGDVPLIETVAEALAGRRAAARRRQLRARPRRGATRAVEAILGRPGTSGSWPRHASRSAVTGEIGRDREPARRATAGSRPTRSRCSSIGPGPSGPTSRSRTRTTAAAVTEICETVDGLPLGIELAAARMAAMSAVEVRDRLADRFRLLQGTTPGPERQLTLASRRRVVVRPAERRASGRCCGRLGVRRRVRSRQHRRRGRERRRDRGAADARLARAQVARHRRPLGAAHARTACSRRSGSSPIDRLDGRRRRRGHA